MTGNESYEIQVKPRKTGKHHSRALRSNREVPAIVYGPKTDNLDFCLAENDAIKYTGQKYENAIFVLKSDDSKLNNTKVIKKDATFHKVNRRPIHIDFYALDMTATVRVHVEVRYEGKSEGEREGGVFNALRRDVEIECLPTDIPEAFSVDISGMNLNDVLHVSDINIPDSFKVMTNTEETIATVAQVKEEVAAPEEVVPAEGDAAAAPAEGGEKKEEAKS